MTTELLERPRLDDGSIGDKETHHWCHCDLETTVCGIEKEMPPTAAFNKQATCIVCTELARGRCEHCGCKFPHLTGL